MSIQTNYTEFYAEHDKFLKTKLNAVGVIVSSAAIKNAPSDLGYLKSQIYFETFPYKVRIIVNTEYAAIQELGGEIKPVTAQALTIPLDKSAKHTRARDWNDLFLVPATDNHKAFLARKTPGGRKIIPMFLLVKHVTMPAQPYLRPAVDESKNKIMKVLSA